MNQVCPLPPSKSTADDIFDAKSKVYDHVFVGGGIASMAPALILMREALKAGKPVDVLVLSKEINAPCMAGSHFVLECEGQFHAGDAERLAFTPLLKPGLAEMVSIVEQEQINCRFKFGYEIKATSEAELNDIISEMVEKNIYAASDFNINSTKQTFNLPGYDHSATIAGIGQVNTPEYIYALPEIIKDKGGAVLNGISYQSHQKNGDHYDIQTDLGIFKSRTQPYMATGAEHMHTMLGKHFKTQVVYTLGAVLGPLSNEDAAKISKGAMAFCDTNLHGDVIWGGLDENNVLTIGFGDMDSPSERAAKEQMIIDKIESTWPGITEKYPPQFSFGAMLHSENKMPVVGSLPDCDVATGWAGMGIVPSHIAGIAYAKKHIHGDSTEWDTLQNLNKHGFDLAHT